MSTDGSSWGGGLKGMDREADHEPPSNAKVKNK